MDGDTDIEGDERSIELSSIAAIFPELTIDSEDPFTGHLDLPVSPLHPLRVIFPPLVSTASLSIQQATTLIQDLSISEGSVPVPSEIKHISHLPALQIRIQLPQGYPSKLPPRIELSSYPSWIPNVKLRALEREVVTLWTELGKDQVIYDYLDLLQQSAEDAFGLEPTDGTALNMPADLEVALLDYDLKAKRTKFEESTFDCGVCLEPKKGAVCYRLQDCGHVFCIECLQSFYNNCITEGDVYSVKCLAPGCEHNSIANTQRQRIAKTLEASELIQIPLDQEQVQRYVKLLRKKRFESNGNTIYCPRTWCQGPAKFLHKTSKENTDIKADTVDSVPSNETEKQNKALPPPGERLCVCEDCRFAFCCVCNAGWHGLFAPCFPRSRSELTAEELATDSYLAKHSQLCPTCRARCQKTMGCNHIECFCCRTHFCYLCRAFLDTENPYKHFNTPHLPCYNRLWVMEEGDGEPDRNNNNDNNQHHHHHVWAPPVETEGEEEEPVRWPEMPPAPPPPPAPVPPNRNNGPPNVRFNRRIQQGLIRPGQLDNNRDGLQRFLAMAAADEEDGWDSDELDDLIDDI